MKKNLCLRKNLVVYAIACAIGTTSLSGCGTNYFDYQLAEDGSVIVNGLITYDKFKTFKLIHLTNEIAEFDKYFLVLENSVYKGHIIDYTYYVDIETGRVVYNDLNDDFKNFRLEIVIDFIVDYLYKYDLVKDEYSIEDVKVLKEYLLENEVMSNIGEVSVLKRRKLYC